MRTEPVSDDTLVKFAAVGSDPDLRNDASNLAIWEEVLFNMLKDRRLAKISANLEKISNREDKP